MTKGVTLVYYFKYVGEVPLGLLFFLYQFAVLKQGGFFMEKTMPFDSEGNFTRVHNWDEDRQNDIDIASDRMDEEFDNYMGGLNDCMLRDGRATMMGDLKMGNFQVKNIAKGTVGSDAVNKEQLDTASSSVAETLTTLLNKLWKIGDIKASVKDVNHDNWFLCDGQAISRVTYSDLFAIIGTNFGGGDGVTTFNLPDYRGKFLRGLGGDSASNIYSTQAEGLPNITGSITPHVYSDNNVGMDLTGAFVGSDQGNYCNPDGGADRSGNRYRTAKLDASVSSAVYGASKHVTPINQAVNYFIKVAEEK